MRHYNTIMNQLLTLIPRGQFESLAKTYSGNHYVKHFTCWNQFGVMLYSHASGKDSLRDIQNSLTVQQKKLYHLGIQSVRRSTLSDANKNRPYEIYENLFYKILHRCKEITPKSKFRFKNPLRILDATVIDLCLSMFSWAKFRTTKGAIKLHFQFDHAGQIPTFLTVTPAKTHEITVARSLFDIIPDSIYCFDKAYIDFKWFYSIHNCKAFFVTRAKNNLKYSVTGQHTDKNKKGVISDEIIRLTGYYQSKDYPESLRLIKFHDKETDKTLTFLTNNFKLASFSIAQIYKARWQIEIFFKWIKQNLKIKTFLGTSKNAVLTQIWTAMCYYLLLAYIKYQTKCKASLFYLHKVIREVLLDRLSLIDILNVTDAILPKIKNTEQQLWLL